jgi:hypothetical protein
MWALAEKHSDIIPAGQLKTLMQDSLECYSDAVAQAQLEYNAGATPSTSYTQYLTRANTDAQEAITLLKTVPLLMLSNPSSLQDVPAQ